MQIFKNYNPFSDEKKDIKILSADENSYVYRCVDVYDGIILFSVIDSETNEPVGTFEYNTATESYYYKNHGKLL